MQAVALDALEHAMGFLDAPSLSRLASTSTGMRQLVGRRQLVRALVGDAVRARREYVDAQLKAGKVIYVVHVPYLSLPAVKRLFRCCEPPAKAADATRRFCCITALQRLLRQGQSDAWHDFAALALTVSNEALKCGYVEILELTLHARSELELDSSDEEDEEDAVLDEPLYAAPGSQESRLDFRYPTGTGPLVLDSGAVTALLLAAAQLGDAAAVRTILTAEDDLADEARLDVQGLKEAVLICARGDHSACCGALLAALARVNRQMMEPVTCSALMEAGEYGHGKFAVTMANMVLARVDRDAQALRDREAAGEAAEEDRQAQAQLDRRLAELSGALKSALIFGCKNGHTEAVRALSESRAQEHLAPETFVLALRHAAMNGSKAIVKLLYDTKRVPSRALYEQFIEAARRDFEETAMALLSLGVLHKAFLEHQRREAFLRESDRVVALIDAHMDAAPEEIPADIAAEEDGEEVQGAGQEGEDGAADGEDATGPSAPSSATRNKDA